MNRRFVTVLGLSAVLALVVSGIFYQITSSAGHPRKAKIDTKQVVVATNPVPLGGVIKASDLKMVAWPAENVPPGSFDKLDEVVDRVAMSNILVEEPVLAGRLAAKGSGLGLSPIIPPGMRAVSVRVNDVISVSGFVLPGSRVDVMVTAVPRAGGESGPVTRTILSNIQVLTAGKNIQPDAKGQPENVPVVTVLVTPEQAEVLTLASGEGRIQLALRNNSDSQQVMGGGVRASDIFTGGVKPAAAEITRPRPRLVRVKMPPPSPTAAAAPPPPPHVELIRGDKKTTEIIPAVYR
ncbi:MAG TPA: Flp pilus assembly protein CpaB [Bryobacterales bacterium]|nr:Flp pilus assembly protein CpaB [Bryobacterales bacterium]